MLSCPTGVEFKHTASTIPAEFMSGTRALCVLPVQFCWQPLMGKIADGCQCVEASESISPAPPFRVFIPCAGPAIVVRVRRLRYFDQQIQWIGGILFVFNLQESY